MVWDAIDQFERSLNASRESLEVAIIHADEARANGEGSIEFGIRVHFDQRFHSKFPPESDGIANHTARRRGRLEFGDDIQAVAFECSRKIAERRSGLYAILQGRFWKDSFAMVHLGAPRFENAVEHGSGIGLSRHFDNFVC